MRRTRWLLAGLAAALAVESAFLAYAVARDRWRAAAASTPVARGRSVAERMGCFGCHGPGGVRPIANPGALGEEVPGWTGGTWMMWNRNEDDVRAWILDGAPAGRAPAEDRVLRMPSYRRWLRGAEVDDLVAYVLAVSAFGTPADPAAAEGRDVALRLGCFGCHGPEGRGTVANPGSFKGYVPAWDGADHAELVADETEFRQWVRDGISERFRRNPAARFFLERQALRMPGYGAHVTEADLDALFAYVRWVRAHPR